MASVDLGYLKSIAVFQGLSDAQVKMVSALIRSRHYPGGVNIIEVGEFSDSVYLLISGTVKAYLERSESADVILAICGPGELLGELSVVDNQGHSANVATLEPSTFYVIERNSFKECLHTMPQLTLNIASTTTKRLRQATTQIHALSRDDVFGRVSRQLLFFADQYGTLLEDGSTQISLRLTQSDIADLIGASRVSVNGVMQVFKKNHTLSTDNNHRITIHNRTALIKRCNAPSTKDELPGQDGSI